MSSMRLFALPIVTSLLWLCLLCVPTAAQFKFDHWTVNDGLPQNTVNAIVQTHDGYLWLATNDGLARFDGMRFTVFNHGSTPGVSGNRFTSLYEDREGTLWAGSEGALTRYRNGGFVSYTVNDGVPEDEIARIEKDEHGVLWVSGRKKSLSRSWVGRFIRYDVTECLPGQFPNKACAMDCGGRKTSATCIFFIMGAGSRLPGKICLARSSLGAALINTAQSGCTRRRTAVCG